MPTYAIILIIIASLALFLFLLLFVFAFICDRIAFGKRLDKNPDMKYFSAQDFNLVSEPVEVRNGRALLRGYIYSGSNCDGKHLIIFCHGMGPGHVAYTKEIFYFCNLGYKVLSIDSTGCNFSDGKNMKGFYEGVKTAVAAIDFAANDARLKDMPVTLIGHSWGAYSVLCASARRKVESVVAISAPDSPAGIMKVQASSVIPKFMCAVLYPYWVMINLLRFGKYGNASASKCAENSGVRTLIIHGDEDNVVRLQDSAYEKANGANITKYLVNGKAHNPYNSDKADKLVQKLIAISLNPIKTKADLEYLKNFDFIAATEEDDAVMQNIADFIKMN